MSAGLTEGNATDQESGSASALNADAISSVDVNTYQAAYVQVTGTFSGTLTFQGSNDNSNFVSVMATDVSNTTQSPILSTSSAGIFYLPTPFRYFRLRMTSYTSGTASALAFFQLDVSGDLSTRNINAIQSGTWTVQSVQSGAWSVGRTWTLSSGTDSVTTVQGTSPWVTNVSQFGGSNIVIGTGASGAGIPRVTVSNDSNILATQSGSWTTGRTWTLSSGTDSVSAVQSGTWTVAQGTPNTLANAWPVKVTDGVNTLPTMDAVSRAGFQKITDGTNTSAVKAGSTAAVAADPALVVALSPNSSIPSGSNSIGTVKAQVQDNSGNGINSNNNQLQVRDVINTSGQNRSQSVTTSAAEALGSATILVNRKFLSITPTNGTIYWGFANTVTTSTGTPIFKNQTVTIAVTDNVHVYVIAASTTDCRVAEGS